MTAILSRSECKKPDVLVEVTKEYCLALCEDKTKHNIYHSLVITTHFLGKIIRLEKSQDYLCEIWEYVVSGSTKMLFEWWK